MCYIPKVTQNWLDALLNLCMKRSLAETFLRDFIKKWFQVWATEPVDLPAEQIEQTEDGAEMTLDQKLTSFQKLIFMKMLMEEKVRLSCVEIKSIL